MATVLYPGSFDPFHNGHRELVETAAYLFDHVVVAAIRNPQKAAGLFSLEERQWMIKESLDHLDNIEIISMATLVVDVALDVGARVGGHRVGRRLHVEVEVVEVRHHSAPVLLTTVTFSLIIRATGSGTMELTSPPKRAMSRMYFDAM